MDWLRWHHGTSTDPKWRVVAKKAGVSLPIVLSIWATMLESASQNVNRGVMDGWEPDEVAAAFDVETQQVQAVYDAMQGKTLDGNRLISWEKRNPKREREDNSTERVQRHRQQVKAKQHQETPCNAAKRPDKRRVEESREEKKENHAADDPRRAPLRDLLVSEFRKRRGMDLITDASDWKAFENLLRATRNVPVLTVEEIQRRWILFLSSDRAFHREQGHPARWFCQNINAFAGDNGTHPGNSNADPRTPAPNSAGARPYQPKQ